MTSIDDRAAGLPADGPCSDSDHYAHHLGIVGVDATSTLGRAELVVAERHINAAGRVHGGALFSLADAAAALAANADANAERVAVVTATHFEFLEAVTLGQRLVATAECEYRHRRRSGYRVRVTRDDELVAVGSWQALLIENKR